MATKQVRTGSLVDCKQRAGDQRGLMRAGATLVVELTAATEGRAAAVTAGRTAEFPGSAGAIQGTAALGFGAVLRDELEHRQAGLELDGVHGMRTTPALRERWTSIRLRGIANSATEH